MSDKIATYTFLPWLRQGIASKIKGGDTLGSGAGPGERATVQISLQVNGDPDFVSQNVELVGPGDVVGISPRAIVRTDPRNWVTDFEPNYLAYIEFYDEDFPWRFTPARAVQRDDAGAPVDDPQRTKLRPWITLLVLAEDEFEQVASPSGPLPAIRLADSAKMEDILPPPGQAWAWAHVHASKDITAAGQAVADLQDLVRQNPDNALSRLMCPRKLRPATAYHAFLVPTFEVGRRAGLGQPTAGLDALAPSWGAGQSEYPVYYRWYFRTGERGDFEYLARLLEPREVDERVGIRDMDMQDPNFGAAGMSTGPGDLIVMGLEGALKSPQAVPRPDIWPPADAADYPAFLNDLVRMVNLQDTLLAPPAGGGNPDPIISPPLYGRWHGLQSRLEVGQPGWVNQLNEDPRLRALAGSGTKVIQAGQETYMQRAWKQLGEGLRANQKIRQVQLSIGASMRVFTRHFANLEAAEQIAVTQQVHARVMASPTTVHQQIRGGRLPQAALRPAFRRITRPRGAIVRKIFAEARGTPAGIVLKLNAGQITAALPKKAPQKQISLNLAADKLSDNRFREKSLTARVVSAIPARPAFKFTLPGERLPSDALVPPQRDSPEGALFRSALLDLHTRLEIAQPAPEPRPQIDVGAISSVLVSSLNPKSAIVRRALSLIHIPATFQQRRPTETIVPVMAHPEFADPMYKPLQELSSELLMPNLNLIPNNTITLLETNPKVIEAYMVGLNHEMGRELLWREYPTDQRGSYFRQFWGVGDAVNRQPAKDARAVEAELRDITPLHTWERATSLGSHENRPLPSGAEPGEPSERKLVLVIRGDLLKKYPSAVIFAQRAKWVDDEDDSSVPPRKIRVLDEGDPQATVREPVFQGEVEPDIHFLGFELSAAEAKGSSTAPEKAGDPGNPGWFFIIQQRPGEPRFGLDLKDGPPEVEVDKLKGWNQLSWNHLGDPNEIPFIKLNPDRIPTVTGDPPDKDIKWGSNAGDMAYILFQVPVMVAIHADNMLK